MVAVRPSIGREATKKSYQRPVLGDFISRVIGTTLPCPFFPSAPSV
jgi:hypothetical protein